MAISSDDVSVLLSSALTTSKGFHTTSITRLALRGSRLRSCTPHLYFTLSAQLFVDPYELDHRRAFYTFQRFGGGDLEAPVFAPGAAGAGGPSGLLLDLAVPEGGDDESVLSIEVPLHARYGVPRTEGEPIDEVLLPPPEAFWACAQEGAVGSGGAGRAQVSDALREVVELAPALEDASTLVLIPRAEPVRAQTLRVPVGDGGDVALVETGTIVVILVAFAYLLRVITRVSRAQYAAVHISVAKKD
ncbi:PIG-X [Lactifluus subvellereus]|nr:PIG-X [Lactifluus subvellereus]